MTRSSVLAVAVAAFVTAAALAGEHPKEHPTGAEHPAGSKKWTRQMTKEYAEAVESHVAKSPDGFRIKDERLSKEWTLKLVGVHKKRVVDLGDSHFFACADFTSVNSKDKLDLDFYASKTGESWSIDQVLIHKVNGAARYTYNDENERVPTGASGTGEKSRRPEPMKDMGSR